MRDGEKKEEERARHDSVGKVFGETNKEVWSVILSVNNCYVG